VLVDAEVKLKALIEPSGIHGWLPEVSEDFGDTCPPLTLPVKLTAVPRRYMPVLSIEPESDELFGWLHSVRG
jgi:hypothetical protein